MLSLTCRQKNASCFPNLRLGEIMGKDMKFLHIKSLFSYSSSRTPMLSVYLPDVDYIIELTKLIFRKIRKPKLRYSQTGIFRYSISPRSVLKIIIMNVRSSLAAFNRKLNIFRERINVETPRGNSLN